MKPLSPNDIEAELSYAYLHAVAAKAGVGCKVGSRHDDNAGIDAELTGWGPFPGGGYLEEININIQLKATIQQPATSGEYCSYSLQGIPRYDDLRNEALATPRILVVLFLPDDSNLWLHHGHRGCPMTLRPIRRLQLGPDLRVGILEPSPPVTQPFPDPRNGDLRPAQAACPTARRAARHAGRETQLALNAEPARHAPWVSSRDAAVRVLARC
ncbi:MAG: DUF4365 domain-containing protein [Candidatus Competibacteraceae bacterium]